MKFDKIIQTDPFEKIGLPMPEFLGSFVGTFGKHGPNSLL
jgi:hypothetical protein